MSRRPAAAAFAAIAAALLAGTISGCAPTVHATAAAHASDAACAAVTVRLPSSVGGLGRRDTDARSTGAWGDPERVLLTCGVTVPRVSSLACVTVDGVDWLRNDDSADVTVYTSYGRDPAIDVAIGASGASSGTSTASGTAVSEHDVLADLAPAVKHSPTDGLVCR